MRLPASLTSRLVLTAVALVLIVCVLIGTVTALVMRSNLMGRLDDDVRSIARPGPAGQISTLNSTPGSLFLVLSADRPAQGGIITTKRGEFNPVSAGGLDQVQRIPADDRPHTVSVPGAGSFRVIALAGAQGPEREPVTVVRGLPLGDVTDTIHSLVFWEALLTLLGVVVAAGAGTYVVRRQLRPLREVAATAHTVARLPLASGEVEVTERVPERLTDEATEVGQVGSALNTLLAHVEDSLAARYRSEQQVRQFVADASHELRTPLTTIRGYTELAQQRSEAVPTALTKVEEESVRMTGLVEDLLLLARLDQGRPLQREPVELTRMLLEAVDDARVVDPDRSWQLHLGAGANPEDSAVVVPGDEQRLHQVVTNLLTNARRHTPPGTTVTVTARPDGFDVHDDGPGFPPELVPHAFERFTRGDAARQRDGGAGLGLSLVQAIVASHGGTVALHSRPGDTTIAVRLPR